MKFQKTPLILLFTALVLGGFVYFFDLRKEPQQAATKAEAKPVFTFKEGEVQAFTIQTSKQTLSFEKATIAPAKNPAIKASAWQMITPEKVAANEGTIAFLLNLLATSRSERTIPTPVARKSEFGLEQPAATVEVKLANQQTHRLLLGKANFNRSSIYALADPPASPNQDLSVLLVPIDFQNGVDRPLAEWKQEKPKDAKSSPTPTATSGVEASPTPSESPILTPSPTASN